MLFVANRKKKFRGGKSDRLLVALTAGEFEALEKTIRKFGIDPESD